MHQLRRCAWGGGGGHVSRPRRRGHRPPLRGHGRVICGGAAAREGGWVARVWAGVFVHGDRCQGGAGGSGAAYALRAGGGAARGDGPSAGHPTVERGREARAHRLHRLAQGLLARLHVGGGGGGAAHRPIARHRRLQDRGVCGRCRRQGQRDPHSPAGQHGAGHVVHVRTLRRGQQRRQLRARGCAYQHAPHGRAHQRVPRGRDGYRGRGRHLHLAEYVAGPRPPALLSVGVHCGWIGRGHAPHRIRPGGHGCG
mmetsp:Transcript_40755/g.130051  ORF Transcript_40755/g.130051 Transcript_40755/m.130051 type:complete len:254 (-) Transcript_40755:2691-3452(-)